jgi:hypothetical protein
MESGERYLGKRLYLTKIREERDSDLIDRHREKLDICSGSFFKVDELCIDQRVLDALVSQETDYVKDVPLSCGIPW